MKPIYVDHLRPLFAGAIEKRGFHFQGKEPKVGSSTKTLYVRKERDDLWFFVVLRPNPKQEFFRLELGWARSAKLPKFTDDHLPSWTDDATELAQASRVVEFVDLYHRALKKTLVGWFVWDCSADPLDPKYIEIFMREDAQPVSAALANDRCRAAVEKCMEDFDAVAVPFLKQVAAFSAS